MKKGLREGDREGSRERGETGRLLQSLESAQALKEWNMRVVRGGLDVADSDETAAKLSPVCEMSERAFFGEGKSKTVLRSNFLKIRLRDRIRSVRPFFLRLTPFLTQMSPSSARNGRARAQ